MPKLEPKIVQKELEQGELWPVYWIYGQERMKSRELLKRIRKTAIGIEGSSASSAGSLATLSEENLDGSEITAESVVDAAMSLSLGGGLRFIVVREAHALKQPEALAALLGPKAKVGELTSVCVFISKDLDGRKKISKLLTEKAAVVACDEIPENEREPWIQYLAKRRGMTVSPEWAMRLTTLDPWGLDIIEQELEKRSLAELSKGGADASVAHFDSDTASLGGASGPEAFLEFFFRRDLKPALEAVETFASKPDEALPLLGLLSWNVRQLVLMAADRANGTRHAKINPYVAEKFARWLPAWELGEFVALQSALADLDFSFKQTPLLPMGLWSSLAQQFCRLLTGP